MTNKEIAMYSFIIRYVCSCCNITHSCHFLFDTQIPIELSFDKMERRHCELTMTRQKRFCVNW